MISSYFFDPSISDNRDLFSLIEEYFFTFLKDDAYWWQARQENERTTRAGLIPSRALQERRIIHDRTQKDSNGEPKSKQFSYEAQLFCLASNHTK